MKEKDKTNTAAMSEAIRELLTDERLLKNVMKSMGNLPPYWQALTKKDGLSAMVMAQLLKALGGDTQAFATLARYGFGEKVQMSISDFYRDNKIEIEIANPEAVGTIVAGDAAKLLNASEGEVITDGNITTENSGAPQEDGPVVGGASQPEQNQSE